MNRARGAFNRALNKLRSRERKVRRLCRIKHCGSGEHAVIVTNIIIITFIPSVHWMSRRVEVCEES